MLRRGGSVPGLVLIAGCAPLAGCVPQGLAVGVPWLVVPESVTTEVVFGVPTVVGLTVENAGTAPAELTVEAEAPLLVLADALVVAPGTTLEVPLSYTPTSYDALTSSVTIRTSVEDHVVALVILVDPDADQDGHLAIGAGGDDCDDADPSRYPGAPEICDDLDQDCDAELDEDVADPPAWYPDADEDGFGDAAGAPVVGCDGPPGWVADGTDCDDGDAAISPAAVELWYDGVDQDCDQGDDFDQDRDGWSSADYGGDDCDDRVAAINPGEAELWYDGVDQDCDGNDDDQDQDGSAGGAFGPDCDDLDPEVQPGAAEADDAKDQDCDGWIDEGLWARGGLIVTEVLTDPVAVSDGDGRFLELLNPSDGHVELGGVTVTTSQAQVLASGYLEPGGVLLLCTQLDPVLNGGLTCDGSIPWGGSVDAVTVTGGGLVLDELSWAGWDPMSPGASLELGAAHLDPDANDDPASWCTATAAYGAGDLGTPGAITNPCP